MKIVHTSIITGIAGSENYLIHCLPGLKDRKLHEIEFIALTPKKYRGKEQKFVDLLTKKGICVHTVYFSVVPVGGLFRLNKILNTLNPDIVHSHLLYADTIISIIKRLFRQKFKFVTTKHGYEESYNAKYGFDPSCRVKNKYWVIAKWAEKKVNAGFAISLALKNLYEGLEISKKDSLRVIHYGFDFSFDLSSKTKTKNLNLVMVGRLTEFKGHKYAIEACSLLKNYDMQFTFRIVGGGALESVLLKQVRDLNLENHVIFEGYRADAYKYMIKADIVLIPSVAEGFGVVVLEAMAAKTPIIAFNVPAINESIINETTGLLIEPYDTHALAKAIVRLEKDHVLREKLSSKAYQHLKIHFSEKRMIDETLAFYESL